MEDDVRNLSLFNAILRKMDNLQIISETQGQQALKSIKAEYPDLIILDIQIPELSGIEICQELRKIEKFKSVPIIAVTAFAMKGDEDRILKAGFNKYISKPIRVKEFRAIVNEFLAE